MEKDTKIFSSNIIRNPRQVKNDLTELLKIAPAQPVIQKECNRRIACDFQPRTDKHFEPKKKTKFKVKTVRDIRNSLEKDVYDSLPLELDKQQNVLLRKIRAGSSRMENTKALAKNMLKGDKPISRYAWQMLMNLNSEEHVYSTQFVMWNGKRIQVNGSKGGKLKFICKHDLGEKVVPSVLKRKPFIKSKGLLRNSLSINFKPGPLTKKRFLDHSYQKYHVGRIDLLDLPMPGLEIQPALGKAVDPTIAHCLHSMRQADGTISEKWAEFSVSVLATVKKENIVQIERDNCITFDLSYKSGQQRILMRRDIDSDNQSPLSKDVADPHTTMTEYSVVTSEIEKILHNMLDSVEISLDQDNMYTGEDELRIGKSEDSNSVLNPSLKDRLKRKCGELERLDVTIIRLTEGCNANPMNVCPNEHCALGCVCSSLECAYKLKRHCGRIECMFECKCDFSKYKVIDSYERDCSELIPGLLSIDNEIISKMAKEEQKFHQTVIVTPENSMLLKSKRRDWKSSRKYPEFFSRMCLKTENKSNKRVAAVVVEKLKLHNVEPWCMIHSLYKCFCKCRFTDNWVPKIIPESTNLCETVQQQNSSATDKSIENVENNGMKTRMSSASQNNWLEKQSTRRKHNSIGVQMKEPESDIAVYAGDYNSARTEPYRGRNYTEEHYLNANKRILELEKNDKTLRNRMISLINLSSNNSLPQTENVNESISVDNNTTNKSLPKAPDVTEPICVDSTEPSTSFVCASDEPIVSSIKLFTQQKPDKAKLVAWLETNYKYHKQRVDKGNVKMSLDPPKPGKMALYPWEFILGRYRDKKNLFLISKGPQYRIFMAVDAKNSLFKDCININEIRFAELHKYPITVRNLLTNAKDLKDNFCILYGLSQCWELAGSVAKMCEKQGINNAVQDNSEGENCAIPEDMYRIDSEESSDVHDPPVLEHQPMTEDNECTSELSKWFVMTVENDFTEIQFYNKGFFVKLESIKKAINVARASGKTVRLSLQKFVDNNGPQFGIYAIPNENESCVFVGPYEKDELLGIETVNKSSNVWKHRRTRGIWITTKKLENFKVIDNPLSFMPPKNAPLSEMMTLTGDRINDNKYAELLGHTNKLVEEGDELSERHHRTKLYKPIKIRKTNEFFHLAPNGTFKPIQQNLSNNIPGLNDSKLLKASLLKSPQTRYTHSVNSSPPIPATLVTLHKKPVAEIAPHVKATTKSPNTENILKPKDGFNRKEKGMFILKPEEINKRLMQNQLPSSSMHSTPYKDEINQELEMDIENFLATSEECVAPNDDIFIVSDEDIDFDTTVNECKIKRWNKVWLECKTVESLGLIPGRENKEGGLSFEFPGFKFTEFYNKEEAFAKLNQVLSRKIYVPRNINLEWQVVESEQDLKKNHILKPEELGSDLVLTKRGIRHKQDLASGKYVMTSDITAIDPHLEDINNRGSDNYLEKHKDTIKDLEAASQLLEDESEALWSKLTNNSDHSEALDGLREQIAARLQSMVSNTQ